MLPEAWGWHLCLVAEIDLMVSKYKDQSWLPESLDLESSKRLVSRHAYLCGIVLVKSERTHPSTGGSYVRSEGKAFCFFIAYLQVSLVSLFILSMNSSTPLLLLPQLIPSSANTRT